MWKVPFIVRVAIPSKRRTNYNTIEFAPKKHQCKKKIKKLKNRTCANVLPRAGGQKDFKTILRQLGPGIYPGSASSSLSFDESMSKQAPSQKNTAPPPPAPEEEEEDTEQLAWDECAKPMAKFVTRCLDTNAKNPEKDDQCQKLYQETAYCFAPLLFPKEDQALANCWGQVENLYYCILFFLFMTLCRRRTRRLCPRIAKIRSRRFKTATVSSSGE